MSESVHCSPEDTERDATIVIRGKVERWKREKWKQSGFRFWLQSMTRGKEHSFWGGEKVKNWRNGRTWFTPDDDKLMEEVHGGEPVTEMEGMTQKKHESWAMIVINHNAGHGRHLNVVDLELEVFARSAISEERDRRGILSPESILIYT